MFEWINSFFSYLLKSIIRAYQLTISPCFGVVFGPRCRFYPTCSSYAIQSIDKYKLSTASFLVVRRLIKCGPWHKGGIDLP